MSDTIQFRFGGAQRLFGKSDWQKIAGGTFAVIGLGGVGSWAVEALVRTGAQNLVLVDFDDICLSNTNRQIHTLTSTVGQLKLTAMAERARQINPAVKLQLLDFRFDADHVDEFFATNPTVVIDCIDKAKHKSLLIAECVQRQIGIVTVGGSGGRQDPTCIQTSDLARSFGDRLLAKTRSLLRSEYGFPKTSRLLGIPTVFSAEPPTYPTTDGCVTFTPDSRTPKPLDCGNGLGTAVFVTGTFGFFAAKLAITELLQKQGIRADANRNQAT